MEQNITCKTAKFFICTVAYNKMMDDGNEKRVKEAFVVDAFTFTEAESRIIEEMQPYMSGEFEIMDISKAPFCRRCRPLLQGEGQISLHRRENMQGEDFYCSIPRTG